MSVDRCSHSVAYRFEGYRCSRCDEPVAARWSSNERWVYRAGLLLSIFFWVGLALGAVEWLGLGRAREWAEGRRVGYGSAGGGEVMAMSCGHSSTRLVELAEGRGQIFCHDCQGLWAASIDRWRCPDCGGLECVCEDTSDQSDTIETFLENLEDNRRRNMMDPNECIRLLGRALNNDQPAEALPYLKDYSEWLAGGGFPATFEAMHNMLDHLRTHLYRVVDQAADGYGLLDEADDRPVRARLRGNEAHLLGSSVRHRLTFEVSSQLEPVRTGWLDEDQIRRVASCIHNQDPEGLLHLDLGAACRVTIDQAEDATSEVRAVMNFIDDSVVRL